MPVFDAGRQAEMYQFFSVAFGAAPGATYWGQLREAVESGMSTLEIVRVFTTKPQFLSAYPQGLRPEEFATRLVDSVIKGSAMPAAKALAAQQITEALAAGLSRGEVIYNVFSNLAGRETDPAQPGYDPADPFVGVARQLANQTKVAQYYTEVLGADSSSLSTLQSILKAVTDQTDVSSAAKLQALVGPLLFDAGRQAEMYHFFSVAFGAAPGATYWGQLREAVEWGMSTLEIVEVFTTKPHFLSTYPLELRPEDFATRLVDNVIKGSATPAAKALAAQQITEALAAGLSRGEVIYNVFSNLAGRETDPAQPGYDPADPYVGVARQMANQTKVAQYYTEVLGADSSSLATLQSILKAVTDQTDVSTPAKLQAIIDAALFNDAPLFTLTAGAPVVEGDAATAAGLVVATYTAPTDDEGDAVTVGFTVGSNAAGYYALNTVTREVTLTAEGAAFVHGGGALPPISLTATDNGTTPAASVQTATPVTTLVNDAPTFTLTTGTAVVEDGATTSLVVATYTAPADEEGDAVTVAFTAGSNTAGYYALNTTTREVTLTATGATFVNGGGMLPQISLTASDNGTTPATSVQAATPVTILVNDAPIFALTTGTAVVEGDATTVAGLVVATYTVPTDEEGDAVTVAFTAGSNAAGYYALNTVTREVTLTSDGAAFVNNGGTLPQISLTATDNGTMPASSVQAATPVTTLVNDAPVIDALGASLAYMENDGASVIAPDATVTDVDSAHFDGGSLTVGFGTTGTGSDQLSVLNLGSGAGQIGVVGGVVSYEGSPIGTVAGGANGADLVISFNSAAATPAAVQALARAIAFANTSDNPSTLARTVGFTVVDGDGTATGGADTGSTTATVTVTAVNDAPTFTLTAGTAVVEDAATTVAGLVVATYTVPTDEEGDAVTVGFTAGSNTAGHYALDTTTREVALTATGAAFVNGGGTLAAISLTATDDGTTPAASVQTVTPVTTLVNDAPTFTLTAGTAVVEDAAATVAGLVVATYTVPGDEEDDAVTVGFTAGSNTAGHYALDTAAHEVALTATGAAFVNGGGTLAAISLTASDSGTTPAASVQTVTPVTTWVNDAPVIDALGSSLAYGENGAPAPIAPGATVADADSAHFDGGSLTVGFGATGTGSDQLSVLNLGSGTGQIGVAGGVVSYEGSPIGTVAGGANGADLVISFNSAAATAAAVQALVRAIAFANSSDNPVTSARSVSFTLVDGDGTAAGGSDTGSTTATVTVAPVNDAPVVVLSAGNAAYTEAGGAVVVDGLLALSDVDSSTLSGATVQITGGYQSGSDTLAFAGSGLTGNIAASAFDVGTGTLTLASAGGTATVAQWQEALRLVRFDSSSPSPGATRVVAFQVDVGDGGSSLSPVQTRTIDITEVNSAPTLAGGGAVVFAENGAALVLDAALVVADPDTLLLAGATVSITTGFVTGQDVLGFTPAGSITGSYNTATGVLSLSGSGTPGEYQQVLRSVAYSNSSDTPSTAPRTVVFQVNDGQGVSNLSNATTVTLNVTAINDAPVVSGGGTLAYVEGGAAAAISPLMAVLDADSANFGGGTLTVGFSANGTAGDQLGILNDGTGPGQVGVSGANVSFGGVVIGTFSGGANGASLVVALNSAATAAAVQALARAVTFSNASEAPSTLPRTVTYTVVDGDGGTDTGFATTTVNVTGVNDAPVTDAQDAVLAYTENAAAMVIAGAMTVGDVDSADFSGGSLTVALAANGTAADQLAVRNEGTGAGQIGVSGAAITFGGAAIGSFTGGTNGTDLVVTFNSAAATPAAVQALARSITFANTSDNPSTLARTVSFTLVDGDGTDAGGIDTGSSTATVNITAVNDAPVVGGGGTLAYTENGAAAAISPAGTVSDPDSGDFNGGSLTVGFTANGTTADQLVVINQGTGAGQIGISGADVTFGGVLIGTVAGGTHGSELVVTFTASEATPAAVQALMQAIGFSNDSDAPSAAPRTVTYTVTDGDGGAQTGLATATVNVTAVNDAPVTVVPADSALGTAMSNVGFAVAGVSISDVDAGSANVQTTVEVTNGVASFDLAGGATVAAGANGSAIVTLQGTVAQVNAALSTFTFKGADGLAAPTTAVVSVVTNDLGNTGTGGALSSNGGTASTFQIGVIPQVFVIDNSANPADDASAGTLANPFDTIASFNALASDGANDVIYLKHGTGTYSEAGGFTLLAGQQLVGQGEALSFTNPVTGKVVEFGAGAAGTTPTVSITGAGNAAVTLAANNTLKGLNLATTLGSQTALSDGNGTVGTLTVSNVDISGSGMAVDIDQGGALNVVIDSLSSSASTQQGVQLAATGAALTGTFTVTAGSISGATGVGFLVGDGAGLANTGGAVAISYGGTVTSGGNAAAVFITDRVANAGDITLSGNINRTAGSADAIKIDDLATGATVRFSGNLDIATTSGTGIAITNNNGAVHFTGGQVTVNTGSGTGVNITGGTGATTFNLSGNDLDIVSTAGGTGFSAADAGTVTVLGDGNTIAATGGVGLSAVNSKMGAPGLKFASISSSNASSGIVLDTTGTQGGLTVTGTGAAGTGGTISGATGAAAIVATNTQDLQLAWMNITSPSGHGIAATNLRGSNALANSEISGFGMGVGNGEDGLRVVNTNTNMTGMTVTNTKFSNAGNANDGIFMEAQGTSNMALSVVNNTFTQFFGDAIQVNGITGSTGTVRLVVKDSDFTNAVASGNGGIAMMPSGDLNFIADINNNVFSGILNNGGAPGAIGVTNGYTADADVTIRNNDLDNIIRGRGISVFADGGTADLLIDNNTIDGLGLNSAAAVSVNYTNGTGTATGNVTVSNNFIGQAAPLWTSGDGTANAILLQTLNGATMTALIQNNVVDANTQSEVVRVRAAGTGTSVMNATVENNELRDTALATRVEFDASAGTAAQNGILNLSIAGNVMNGGGLKLSEGALGTLNVAQSSLLQVGATNDANSSSSGTPTFGQPTPAQPSTPSTPLMATHGPVAGQDAGTLALDDLKALAGAAIARWVEVGINAEQLALLESVAFGVADLKGSILGLSSAGLVLVDSNAAGWGWFVDDTPMADEEFSASESTEGQAATRMDLLTVLTHELGHILGLDDDYAGVQNAVMHGMLDIGQRYMPEAQLVGVAPALFGDGG